MSRPESPRFCVPVKDSGVTPMIVTGTLFMLTTRLTTFGSEPKRRVHTA